MKKPTPVSDLLLQGGGRLATLAAGAAAAERQLGMVRRHLPSDLAPRVFATVLQDRTLTLLVRSAAWGTRIRYLLPPLQPAFEAELGTTLERIVVKVRAGRG